MLARLAYDGSIPSVRWQDYERRGRSLFEDGCESGVGADCFALGESYDWQAIDYNQRDVAAALAAYTKGCDLDHETSCQKIYDLVNAEADRVSALPSTA
jgi:TPR repeat protein